MSYMDIYVIFIKGNLCPAFPGRTRGQRVLPVSAASQLPSIQSNTLVGRHIWVAYSVHFIEYYNVFSIIIIKKTQIKTIMRCHRKAINLA